MKIASRSASTSSRSVASGRGAVFVLFAALAATACSEGDPAAPTPTTSASADVSHRVVVAGAGLAGLTAAVDLRDAGWEVAVLEARDRVGGRVHTLRDPFSDGLHAEAGGESIDDNHVAIQALAQRYGLPLEHRPKNKYDDGVVYYQGQRSSVDDFFDTKTNADWNVYEQAVFDLAKGIDPEHPELAPNAAALDAESLADFIDGLNLGPRAKFFATVENRGELNAEPKDVSLLWYAQGVAATIDVPDSAEETMRISGGNSLLPEAMANDLGAAVSLSSPVTKIEERADRVRVTAGDRVVEGAYLVVAIPTPPLRKIVFDPPLPPDLAAMVAELDLGSAVKVITEYDDRFWETEGSSGFIDSDQPFGIGWSPTDSYASAHGLMSQFITANDALAAAKLDDATRIATFQAQLDAVYPEGVSHKTTHAATMAWPNEPYTGGGYGLFHPGQVTRFWSALRAGTPRIRFAGEYTESLPGYMDSAVRSGHRVAGELGAP